MPLTTMDSPKRAAVGVTEVILGWAWLRLAVAARISRRQKLRMIIMFLSCGDHGQFLVRKKRCGTKLVPGTTYSKARNGAALVFTGVQLERSVDASITKSRSAVQVRRKRGWPLVSSSSQSRRKGEVLTLTTATLLLV